MRVELQPVSILFTHYSHAYLTTFSWLIYISPHRYASEAMLWAVFDGQELTGYDACVQASTQANSTATCFGATGDVVLDKLGENYSEIKPGYWILVLVAFSVALRLGQWLAIRSSV